MDIKDRTNETFTARTGRPTRRGLTDQQRIIALAIGDVIVFLVFAAVGRRNHGETSAVLSVTITALPFAIAWFIVSPFVGAFRRGLELQPGKMALRTLLAWLASWPVALLLRGIFVDQGVPPWNFAIITLIANTILLLLWRVPFALFNSLRKR